MHSIHNEYVVKAPKFRFPRAARVKTAPIKLKHISSERRIESVPTVNVAKAVAEALKAPGRHLWIIHPSLLGDNIIVDT